MDDAAEADAPAEERKFSGTKPTLIADNGHGTKVKLWKNSGKNGEFATVSIERSYKDGDDWKTQKVSLNADDLLSVAHGLEKAHSHIVENRIGTQRGATRE